MMIFYNVVMIKTFK